MIKDTDFYNKESVQYSSKRYPAQARTYVQFFFKKRLDVLISMMKKRCEGRSALTLLEVGCADGVVIRDIETKMNNTFSSLVGIDIAPQMISSAKAMTSSPNISYFVRGEEPGQTYDVVVEVGVANYANFEEELIHAEKVLKPGGVYFLSIAGRGSFNDVFGRGVGYNNFESYARYESMMQKIFVIEEIRAVGLFLPLIWLLPPVARVIQSITEFLFGRVFPGLFHEKIYILRK